jgi:plastocyanin
MRKCFVLLLLSLTVGCNDEDLLEPQPPELEEDVQATTSNTFNPNNVTIAVGGTVHYVFQTTLHTVIFERKNGAPDDIIQATSNATVDREFLVIGQYPYECGIHPGMRGTVFVQALIP